MREKIARLFAKYGLGALKGDPKPASGGLMHRMFGVCAETGRYAVKQLNPDIVKRPGALQNMINSELIAKKLKGRVPLLASKSFGGKNVIELEGHYYLIFDWVDGKSVFPPDISEYHCQQIGRILGRIHAADISVEGVEREENAQKTYAWNELFEMAREQTAEIGAVLRDNLPDILLWSERAASAVCEKTAQVISHRDLDPKNVMWKSGQPLVIDWEAAGYVSPAQELIEVVNNWVPEGSESFKKARLDAMLDAYTENMDVSGFDWETAINSGFSGMLGWLEYSFKRSLGMEGTSPETVRDGARQVKETIRELKLYEKRAKQLKNYLFEYSVGGM